MHITLQPESQTSVGANLATDTGSLAYRLFAQDKLAQFAAIGLPQAHAEMLVQMQWRGRNLTYATQYPGAEDCVISLEEGTPVGRYLLQKIQDSWRIVDLAILPKWRGQGIGTRLLEQLARQASAEGLALTLRVEKNNPALRLYTRLGFAIVGNDELSYEMVLQQH